MNSAENYSVYKNLDRKHHERLDYVSVEIIKILRDNAHFVKYDGTWKILGEYLYPTIEYQNGELLEKKIDPILAKSARWLGNNGVKNPLICMVYSLYFIAKKDGLSKGDLGDAIFLTIYRILSFHFDLLIYRDLIKSGSDYERQSDLRFKLVSSGLIKLKPKKTKKKQRKKR